jgi:hemoglobin
MQQQTLFEELGGEPVLRRIIDRFVDRVFDDLMIGFVFRAADRARVKDKEYEFAAQHLGAAVVYSGRAIEEAHRAHRILGGQFLRRLTILKETLAEFAVPERVREYWLAHTLSLMPLVTRNNSGECDADGALLDTPSPDAKNTPA